MRLASVWVANYNAAMQDFIPLKPLHDDRCLSPAKLALLDSFSTEKLKSTLLPGKPDCLKVRPDGTILDGHHRVFLLRQRGVDVDSLPREIQAKRTD